MGAGLIAAQVVQASLCVSVLQWDSKRRYLITRCVSESECVRGRENMKPFASTGSVWQQSSKVERWALEVFIIIFIPILKHFKGSVYPKFSHLPL